MRNPATPKRAEWMRGVGGELEAPEDEGEGHDGAGVGQAGDDGEKRRAEEGAAFAEAGGGDEGLAVSGLEGVDEAQAEGDQEDGGQGGTGGGVEELGEARG